jgi:sporulation protein YlmC with PRC-barrel domain
MATRTTVSSRHFVFGRSARVTNKIASLRRRVGRVQDITLLLYKHTMAMSETGPRTNKRPRRVGRVQDITLLLYKNTMAMSETGPRTNKRPRRVGRVQDITLLLFKNTDKKRPQRDSAYVLHFFRKLARCTSADVCSKSPISSCRNNRASTHGLVAVHSIA